MSKDVIIAGVVVTACLALVGVAFLGGSGTGGERKSTLASTGSSGRNDLSGFNPPPDFGPPPTPVPAPPTPPGPVFPPIEAPAPTGSKPTPTPGPTPPPSPNDDLFAPLPTVPTTTPPVGAVPPTVPGAFGDVPPVATNGGVTKPEVGTSISSGLSGGGTHTVKANETLGDISSVHYKTSRHWKKILDANPGVDPTNLKIGQTLAIPAVASDKGDKADGAHTAGDGTYIVQRGDSYYSIAKKHLGSASRWREIEKLNKIAAEDLTPGQKIKLPAKGGSAEGGKGWVVEEGDTLGEISKKHYGTTQVVDQIIAANPGVDPTHLKPGQHLVLPEAKIANVHVVERGDTLGEISKKHYGTTTKWKDIVKANPGIDAEALKVGTRLILPGKPLANPGTPSGDTSKPPATPVTGPELATGEFYTVQQGDVLTAIAKKLLGSQARWKDILDANPGIDPNNLRQGLKLRIPSKGPAAQPVPGPATLPAAGPQNSGAVQAPASAPRAPEPVDDLFAPVPGPTPAAPAGPPATRPNDNLGLRL